MNLYWLVVVALGSAVQGCKHWDAAELELHLHALLLSHIQSAASSVRQLVALDSDPVLEQMYALQAALLLALEHKDCFGLWFEF